MEKPAHNNANKTGQAKTTKTAPGPGLNAKTSTKPKPNTNTTTNTTTTPKPSKNLIILIVAAVVTIIVIVIVLIIATNQPSSDSIPIGDQGQAKIVKTEVNQIQYETYDNGLVSFEHPAGWKVEVAPVDYIHYAFKAYNPENPTYMFLFGMKMEGALKSERARQVYASYYPDAPFSKIAAIDPQTTEAFYKVWNQNSDYNNSSLGTNFFSHLNNFKVVDNLGKDMMGGDILRATYTDVNGKPAEGLFTAAVKSVGTYYISENIWNPFGPQVDVSPLNIYNIMIMSAPEAEFINWQKPLDHCLSTIQFSNAFIAGFNQEEDTLLKTIQANQKVYDQISDMIMDSWNKRNNSYDIISQKQSDATLGYERVYDTETGEIYKAYNGFTDDYTGNRYQPITDNMYTETISGYIEK
ncbi:DUF287 domain-containing protein [Candidatus Saccharibacteria bacterium]|nr:DUF287 domain-containing protein [Candidatus Saccharibacteria bacterium]